jgi:hypothetical protein
MLFAFYVAACGGKVVSDASGGASPSSSPATGAAAPPGSGTLAPGASFDTPQALASVGAGFEGLNIALDSDSAYVADSSEGVIRVALDGSGKTSLDLPSAEVVAVDSTRVYTLGGDGRTPVGLVAACDKSRCSSGDYTTVASNQVGALDIAVDDTSVYWAGPAPVGVTKVALAGGMPTQLVPGFSAALLAVAGGKVFFAGAAGRYESPSSLLSVPVSGGPVSTVFSPASPTTSVNSLVADSQYVYFGVDDGRLGKAPLGGGPATILATGLPAFGGGFQIAVDASHVYFPHFEGISAVPLSGGAATPLVSVQDCMGVAADARALYWTTRSGAVMIATKK